MPPDYAPTHRGCSYRKRHWCIFHAPALAKKAGRQHVPASKRQRATCFRQRLFSGSVPGGKNLPVRNSKAGYCPGNQACFGRGKSSRAARKHAKQQDEPQMAGCLTGRSCHFCSGCQGWAGGTTPFRVRLPNRTGDDSGRVSLFGFTLLLTSEIAAQLTCQIFP